MVLLETARLRLRQFTPDDVDRLVELDSDPEVMRYVTFGAPTPRDQGAAALLEHGFRRVGADKISARALAGNAASQAVMGKCGLRYETDFVYPEDVIGVRSVAERAAVKYSITRSQWQTGRKA